MELLMFVMIILAMSKTLNYVKSALLNKARICEVSFRKIYIEVSTNIIM